MPEKCEGHGSQELCAESGLVANEYCPTKKVNNYGAAVPKEKLKLWKTVGASNVTGKKVTDICNIHKKPEEKPKENNTTNTNGNTNVANTTNTQNTNTTNITNTTNSKNNTANTTQSNTSTNTNTNNTDTQTPAT